MISKLKEILFPKRVYLFKVRYSYVNQNGTEIFSWEASVKLEDKKQIKKERTLKKLCPFNSVTQNLSHLLCNGELNVKPLNYVGAFSS